MRIEDFQFVQVIEEPMVAFEIDKMSYCSTRYGSICNVDIMSFFLSICNPGEVSIQDRIINYPQLHDKILVCLS